MTAIRELFCAYTALWSDAWNNEDWFLRSLSRLILFCGHAAGVIVLAVILVLLSHGSR